MQSAMIVGQQVLIMFLLMVVGMYSRRTNMLTEDAARCCSTFLLNVALPCSMIASLYVEKKPHLLPGFVLAVALGAVMHTIGVISAKLFIKERPGEMCHAERFALVFANSAYMAIPLVTAVLGEEAAFYPVAFVTMFQTFHWTYGVIELGGTVNPAKLLKNPCIISVFLGFALFWFQIPIPSPVMGTVRLLGGLTSSLSMIIAGVFLADVKISDMRGRNMYFLAFLRCLAVPMVIVALLYFSGVSNWFEGAKVPVMASLYCYACPSAVSVILMSASLGKDAVYPSKLVALTTVISLICLPLISAIAEILL
ncbi:MAG: AEC family transporter [Oscillospiraceae bacterium]|nr:AEC family transporter [Oscillospiraceae bacterium]MBP1577384.1 AEC family transporter [Oscillospiraceae bacterium]